MIKEKFLKFLNWLKDHFLFLLEVVVRLSVGLSKENNVTKDFADTEETAMKGDSHDE